MNKQEAREEKNKQESIEEEVDYGDYEPDPYDEWVEHWHEVLKERLEKFWDQMKKDKSSYYASKEKERFVKDSVEIIQEITSTKIKVNKYGLIEVYDKKKYEVFKKL